MAWSPHKMLGAPLQCSAVLTRHVGALADCNSTHAEYLYQPDKLHADCDLGDKASGGLLRDRPLPVRHIPGSVPR